MTLTEQWKKGELEQGYYYTKYNPKVGEPFVEIELRSYLLDLAKVRDVDTVEVLAPVPSYDHFVELTEKVKENQQLNKRLLDMMDLLQKSYFYLNAVADKKVKTEHLEQIKTLTVLIDNAIGEK